STRRQAGCLRDSACRSWTSPSSPDRIEAIMKAGTPVTADHEPEFMINADRNADRNTDGNAEGPVWHVRGVLLPDDEVTDLWVVGDRISRQPVPGAQTLAERGFILPGLVDAHCHLGIRNGGAPIESLDEARDLATMDRDAGVLALRDAGSPYP